MMKKKKVTKEIEKRGQNALNALNALNVHHRKIIKNVPDHRLMMRKATKEIEKKGEATETSWLILHAKLHRRKERLHLKGRFSFRSVDFFTNILLIEIMIANPNQLRVLRKEQKNRFW